MSSLLTFSIPRLSLSITYSRCTTYELLLRSRRAQKDRFIGWEREEEEEEEGWLGLALWLLSIPPFLATYSAQIFRAFHLLLPSLTWSAERRKWNGINLSLMTQSKYPRFICGFALSCLSIQPSGTAAVVPANRCLLKRSRSTIWNISKTTQACFALILVSFLLSGGFSFFHPFFSFQELASLDDLHYWMILAEWRRNFICIFYYI